MKYCAAILAAAFSVASAQIFDPIIAAGDYSSLLDAVVKTGNDVVITENAPVTIFGPKDSAFAAISDLVATLTDEELSAVLLDHVIVGANVTAAAVVEAGCLEAETAGGLMLGIHFDEAASSVTVNGIPVTAFDIAGDYGILHGLEGVLVEGVLGDFVPCPPPAILTPIFDKGTYSILIEAIVGAELLPDIAANLPVTIFGPKDSAFEAIQAAVENLSAEEVKAVLLNHVILGANVTASDVVAAGCLEVPTAGGLMLGINFDAENSTVTVNGVPVTDFDVTGDYGVLHGIESVLVEGLQGDFVPCPAFEADFSPIAAKGNYDTLLGAVVATGNDATISANAPVTIFGPKDSAFAAIQEVVDGLTPEELSAVLLNHVIVDVAVDASTVVASKCIDAITAGGMEVAIRYNETTNVVDINGIIVDDFDIAGDYGVMHGMDGVLVDPAAYVPCPIPSVVEQVAMTGNYSTLLGFLENPLLQGNLDSIGPITIFGPDNAAFAAIADTVATLDQATLITTLGGHVVSGVYTSEMVKEKGCVMLDTIVGTKIRAMYMDHDDHDEHSDMDGHNHRRLASHMAMDDHDDHEEEKEGIMINDAMVILADIADETSIFHGLDKVLVGGTFECPTMAPVAAPTAAPAVATQSGASFFGISAVLAAMVAVSAFVF